MRHRRPPTSRLECTLRQIDVPAFSEQATGVFTHFFPQFQLLATLPPEMRHLEQQPQYLVTGELKVLSFDGERHRRFAGDSTLPRNRYWALEPSRSDPSNNSLMYELFAYTSPYTRLIPELSDSSLDAILVDELIKKHLISGKRPCLVHIIRPHNEGDLPIHLGINPKEVTFIEYPLLIENAPIDNVLDLRQLDAAQWMVEFCTAMEGDLAGLLDEVTVPDVPMSRFMGLLRVLVSQELGGNIPILQGIGNRLRSQGVAGLTFPSSRCDSGVVVADGVVQEHWGFNFVDYREAPSLKFRPKEYFGKLFELPAYEDVRFGVLKDEGLEGSWMIAGMKDAQDERFAALCRSADAARDAAVDALDEGLRKPSDPLWYVLGPDFFWDTIQFPTLGSFIADSWVIQPLEGYASRLRYEGRGWYLTREGPESWCHLICPRCGEFVEIRINRQTPPKTCPSCGLSDD